MKYARKPSRRHLFSFAAAALLAIAAPKRGMIVRPSRVENAEMPLEDFLESEITAIDEFLVRSLHYVSTVDLATGRRFEMRSETSAPPSLLLRRRFPVR